VITLDQLLGPYKGHKDVTPAVIDAATSFLSRVSLLESMAIADGVVFPVNPKTGTGVSGHANGGFRPKDCPDGAPGSPHKQGRGVDRFDPHERIDAWCMKNLDRLREVGIYIEHPEATPGWSHWTDRPPASKRIVFYP